nr:asparagine synthase (glutamine-hydrolyzing) [Pseudopedobacter sp.]
MCRISGSFIPKNADKLDIPAIGIRMRDVLAYGGPDDAGEYMDDQVYLGHRRLSIIDLTDAGHQPMHFKECVIVFNGEIYNYKEVSNELKLKGYHFDTHSDTEVILKAFDCWSYACVDKFRGMFAFALWNVKTKKLLLCRDRVGVKPLYWYLKDGVFLFASELKSFHQFPTFNQEIDDEAVSLYLQKGYIPSPYSIYKHAKKLTPGSFLEIDEALNIKNWKYWNVNEVKVDENILLSDEQVIAKAEDIIKESCDLRMVADVPVGVFLSGGIDSSLVTALLQKNSTEKIKTFTVGFEDQNFDESSHAKQVANYLGTEHEELICTENDFLRVIDLLPEMYDEPFGDSSAIPTFLVSEMAKKQVTVALSAEGGDEVFAGYDRYRLTKKVYDKLQYCPLAIREFMAKNLVKLNPKSIEHVSGFLLKQQLKGLEWRIPKIANVLTANSVFDFYERSSSNVPFNLLSSFHQVDATHLEAERLSTGKESFYSSLGKIDVVNYLEGDILTKVDRATMRVALEGREPLLDHKIIEFGLSLPDHYKVRNGKAKWVLRELLYQYIPKELVDRPKQGFSIPVKEWLQLNLKDFIDELLEDTAFLKLFKFDQSELKRIVHSFYGPKAVVNPYLMWSLYSLYRWYLKWEKV